MGRRHQPQVLTQNGSPDGRYADGRLLKAIEREIIDRIENSTTLQLTRARRIAVLTLYGQRKLEPRIATGEASDGEKRQYVEICRLIEKMLDGFGLTDATQGPTFNPKLPSATGIEH